MMSAPKANEHPKAHKHQLHQRSYEQTYRQKPPEGREQVRHCSENSWRPLSTVTGS